MESDDEIVKEGPEPYISDEILGYADNCTKGSGSFLLKILVES